MPQYQRGRWLIIIRSVNLERVFFNPYITAMRSGVSSFGNGIEDGIAIDRITIEANYLLRQSYCKWYCVEMDNSQ